MFQQGNIQAVEDFPDFDRNGDGKVDDNDLLFAVALRSSTPTKPLFLPNDDNYHSALFAQDDWKASNKLTLNVGLRWELDSNLNNLSWYGNRNPIMQSFYHGTRHRDFDNFAPRVGFNFAPSEKTSVHGGYGIYYDRITLEVMSLEKGFDGRALALNVTAGNAVSDPNGNPVYLNSNGHSFPVRHNYFPVPSVGLSSRVRDPPVSMSSTTVCAIQWSNNSIWAFKKSLARILLSQ